MSQYPSPADLLPHDHPMVLLDEVVDFDGVRAVAATTIREESLFLEPEGVPALVSIEYMAQCVGVFAGLKCQSVGSPVQPGLLLGCRRMTLHRQWLAVGERVVQEATLVWGGDDALAVFETTAHVGTELVATARLNVVMGEVWKLARTR